MQNKPRVEGSTESLTDLQPDKPFNISGLEEIKRSIIPVPFYRLVQPTSEKVFLPDGKRAENGTFLKQDERKTTDELRFIILRAKRQVREQENEISGIEKVVSLNILGIDLDRARPFILSVPVTSFGAFGRVFADLELRNAKNAWDYPVYADTVEIVKDKNINGEVKQVRYWVIEAEIYGEKITGKQAEIAKGCYEDFAERLDRNIDPDNDFAALGGRHQESEIK